jgi:hypothetical protein
METTSAREGSMEATEGRAGVAFFEPARFRDAGAEG